MNAFDIYRISTEITESIQDLITDQKNGASYLERKALGVIGRAAFLDDSTTKENFTSNIEKICRAISDARPTMASIKISAMKALEILIDLDKEIDELFELKALFQKSIARLIQKSFENLENIIQNMKFLFQEERRILTISNSSTIEKIFSRYKNKIREVVICESRPLNEGKITAEFCLNLGLNVTFITDAQAGSFIDNIDFIISGADSIIKGVHLVNKVGTFLIALAAKRKNIPFYVISQTDKFIPLDFKNSDPDIPDVNNQDGDSFIKLEEKNPDEVWEYRSENLKVRNVYFDITPPDLIAGIITEDGVTSPEESEMYIERNKKWLSV
jgi:translation initiation factor 2B subunit (eIF-2B alpha/beta/delta family)